MVKKRSVDSVAVFSTRTVKVSARHTMQLAIDVGRRDILGKFVSPKNNQLARLLKITLKKKLVIACTRGS